jgi:hypothetical protein
MSRNAKDNKSKNLAPEFLDRDHERNKHMEKSSRKIVLTPSGEAAGSRRAKFPARPPRHLAFFAPGKSVNEGSFA